MGIDPDKYIVFNRRQHDDDRKPDQEITDAVVIRLQDVFAPSVLHNYAHQIELALKLNPDMAKAQRKNLSDLGRYMHDMAMQAEEHQSAKLPTL